MSIGTPRYVVYHWDGLRPAKYVAHSEVLEVALYYVRTIARRYPTAMLRVIREQGV